MKDHARRRRTRPLILGGVFLVVSLVYLIILAVLELSPANILGHRQDGTTERTVVVRAVRGEIYDRNGVPLVTNHYTYNLTVDYSVLPTDNETRNRILLDARHTLAICGEADRFVAYDFPFEGQYPDLVYAVGFETGDESLLDTFLSVVQANGLRREAILRLKDGGRLNTSAATAAYEADPTGAITAERLLDYFIKEYDLNARGTDNAPLYTNAEIDSLLRMLWGMEAVGFSRANDYVMAKNISMNTVTHEKERGLRGVGFSTETSRVYTYPSVASHILGQTGPIYAEEWEEYRDLGYAMNAIVGKSGCEAAFESYLHGQDGIKVIVEDEDGRVVREYMKTEAIAGQDVYLTIDINLQMAAEESLLENILYVQTSFAREDCRAGAVVAMDPNTGEVLALASYPTYDLATYNRDYATLSTNPDMPLLNRALSGVYAPGSTFKPAMVAACFSEGILDARSLLECAGTYTYFQSYQPDCWIYNSGGTVRSHGYLDAAGALRVSCNCYFYEAGRRLGIQSMNHYCRLFGLGESTGIELGESVGSLAGPDYRAAVHGLEWQATDTIAAAIGQSDNAFTPLQLASYLSTMVNGGNRYAAHLLLKVRDFSTRTDTLVSKPSVLSSVDLSAAALDTILDGMEQVVSSSAQIRSYMSGVPVTVAGKTGTAQTGATDNGLFVACAPSRSPEIVVTSVIERAGGGSYSAMSAGAVLEAYFQGRTSGN